MKNNIEMISVSNQEKVANLTDGDTTILKRTLREIRILRHLTHENV